MLKLFLATLQGNGRSSTFVCLEKSSVACPCDSGATWRTETQLTAHQDKIFALVIALNLYKKMVAMRPVVHWLTLHCNKKYLVDAINYWGTFTAVCMCLTDVMSMNYSLRHVAQNSQLCSNLDFPEKRNSTASSLFPSSLNILSAMICYVLTVQFGPDIWRL